MKILLALLAALTLACGEAHAQAASRAPEWAQSLLVADVDAVTVARTRLAAPEGGIAVRLSVAPAQGGVARLVKFVSSPDSATFSLWRFTGHIRNGWVLWGGEAPLVLPLDPARRATLERLARAALSAGALGVENGGADTSACSNGDYAWLEISDPSRSALFERRCAMSGAAGALIRAMIEIAGNRDEEELYRSGVEEVLATDRAFATAARTEGLPKAVVTFGAPDALLLQGGQPPVEGQEALGMLPQPESDGSALSWTPHRAEIAARGDMAWSWGDWTRTLDGRPAGAGSYVAVWRRDPDGAWKSSAFMLN